MVGFSMILEGNFYLKNNTTKIIFKNQNYYFVFYEGIDAKNKGEKKIKPSSWNNYHWLRQLLVCSPEHVPCDLELCVSFQKLETIIAMHFKVV